MSSLPVVLSFNPFLFPPQDGQCCRGLSSCRHPGGGGGTSRDGQEGLGQARSCRHRLRHQLPARPQEEVRQTPGGGRVLPRGVGCGGGHHPGAWRGGTHDGGHADVQHGSLRCQVISEPPLALSPNCYFPPQDLQGNPERLLVAVSVNSQPTGESPL